MSGNSWLKYVSCRICKSFCCLRLSGLRVLGKANRRKSSLSGFLSSRLGDPPQLVENLLLNLR